MLLPGLNKVLAIGGNKGALTTNTADIIDFSSATPQWRPTGSMNLARQDFNAVLLPDGTVLSWRQRRGTIPKQAEIFDPVTEKWTLMAAQTAMKAYHSTAVLLPDGRVLSAGDGDGLRLKGGDLFPAVPVQRPTTHDRFGDHVARIRAAVHDLHLRR